MFSDHTSDVPHRGVHLVPVGTKPWETAQASGGSGPSYERVGRRPSWAHHTDALPAIRTQGVTEVTWKHHTDALPAIRPQGVTEVTWTHRTDALPAIRPQGVTVVTWIHRTDALPAIRPQGVTEVTWVTRCIRSKEFHQNTHIDFMGSIVTYRQHSRW